MRPSNIDLHNPSVFFSACGYRGGEMASWILKDSLFVLSKGKRAPALTSDNNEERRHEKVADFFPLGVAHLMPDSQFCYGIPEYITNFSAQKGSPNGHVEFAYDPFSSYSLMKWQSFIDYANEILIHPHTRAQPYTIIPAEYGLQFDRRTSRWPSGEAIRQADTCALYVCVCVNRRICHFGILN